MYTRQRTTAIVFSPYRRRTKKKKTTVHGLRAEKRTSGGEGMEVVARVRYAAEETGHVCRRPVADTTVQVGPKTDDDVECRG